MGRLIKNALFGLFLAIGFDIAAFIPMLILLPSKTLDIISFMTLILFPVCGILVSLPEMMEHKKRTVELSHLKLCIALWALILALISAVALAASGTLKSGWAIAVVVFFAVLIALELFQPFDMCENSGLIAGIILLLTIPSISVYLALMAQSLILILLVMAGGFFFVMQKAEAY